ncbi:MAG: hypothetical protein ACRBCL_01135 [Maritimibacter sp.]
MPAAQVFENQRRGGAVTPDQIGELFTQAGDYRFARWGRAIVPVVFGVEDAALSVIKGAIEAVAASVAHPVGETDPELGANVMIFFFERWDELLELPKLGEMIPDLASRVARLKTAQATQYRAFRFDNDGAIQASFVFVRMAGGMEELPAETIALTQAVQIMLTWGEGAFAQQSPLGIDPASGAAVVRPDIADLLRAAYDPVLPPAADDPSHALRLFARLAQ